MAAPLVLALLAGIATVEESIAFIFFIEEESIQVIQMSIFQCLRYNQKTEAKRLLNELEHHYLKMMYDDLDSVWGEGLGYNVDTRHFGVFYGHGAFSMFADAVFEQVQAYKKIL